MTLTSAKRLTITCIPGVVNGTMISLCSKDTIDLKINVIVSVEQIIILS